MGTEELEAQIAAQGDKIKQLKADGAAPDVIKPAVAALLALKEQLPEGHALKPVPKKKKEKAAAKPQPKPKAAKKPPAAAAAAAPAVDTGAAYALITQNLAGVEGEATIKKVLGGSTALNVLWTVPTTGRVDTSMLVAVSKLADFLKAGCKVTALLGDIHSSLDTASVPFELHAARVAYYHALLADMLACFSAPVAQFSVRVASEYQLNSDFMLDVYKLSSMVSLEKAEQGAVGVALQAGSAPSMGHLLYPCMQALDEQYNGAHVQFGGANCADMFAFARHFLPLIGYEARAHLTHSAELPADMSIELFTEAKAISKKINKAFCEEKNVQLNGPLLFSQLVLFPWLAGKSFQIVRDEKFGGDMQFSSYEAMHSAFHTGELYPLDLKNGVAQQLGAMLASLTPSKDSTAVLEAAAFPVAQKKVKETKKASADTKDTSNRPSPEELARRKAEAAAKKKANADAMKAKSKGGAAPTAEAKADVKKEAPKEAKPAVKGAPNKEKTTTEHTIAAIDIRVGKIVDVWEVEGSDKLFGESIDVGEAEPRRICSGLRQFYTLEQMKGRTILVICNLKARTMAGFKSHGMVFCAKSDDGNTVEFVDPPAGCVPGDKVVFEGVAGEVISPAQVAKHKVLEKSFPDLKTNGNKEATWKGVVFGTSHGPCTVPTLANATIS